jgi:hypothetical protein
MNVTAFFAKEYENLQPFSRRKNKPNQTQNLGIDRGKERGDNSTSGMRAKIVAHYPSNKRRRL